MNIQNACENKGTLPEFPNMYCLIVHLPDNTLSPCWYDAKTDHLARDVTGKEALRTDWIVYHPKEEIRPKEAGELWEFKNNMVQDNYLTIFAKGGSAIWLIKDTYTHIVSEKVTHGGNGWTRLHPPVPDDSVEEIVIDGAYLANVITESPFSRTIGGWNSFLYNLSEHGLKIMPKVS